MAGNAVGLYWEIDYGEISENKAFRILRKGASSPDVVLPIASLSDFTATATAMLSQPIDTFYRGSIYQGTWLSNSYPYDLVLSYLSYTQVAPLLRFAKDELADLVTTLGVFTANVDDPEAWDSSPIPVPWVTEAGLDDAVTDLVKDPTSDLSGELNATYARTVSLDVRNFGAVCDGTTDDTAAVQAAIDAAATLATGTNPSVTVTLPRARIKTGKLYLKSRVILQGQSRPFGQGYRTGGTIIDAASSVGDGEFVINGNGGAVLQAGIIGISSYGGGSTGNTGFISIDSSADLVIANVYAEGYSREALKLDYAANARISYSFFQGLRNTSLLTEITGSAVIGGPDNQISFCEFTGPQQTITSGSLYAAALWMKGGYSAFTACVFQTADIGLRLAGIGNRFTGCRFDVNAGHGLYGASGDFNVFTGCHFNRNSRNAANTYDHVNIPAAGIGQSIFTGCMFTNEDTAVRWAINDARNDVFANKYVMPTGQAGTTGFINTGNYVPVVDDNVAKTRLKFGAPSTWSGAVSVAADVVQRAACRRRFLGGNITITLADGPADVVFETLFELVQDGTGGRTVTWTSGATIRFEGGTPPTVASGANKITLIRLLWMGSYWFISGVADIRVP